MGNRINCTFVDPGDSLQEIVDNIKRTYQVLNDKIFVLSGINDRRLFVTYNVDNFNMDLDFRIPNTILMHRKKHTNTIYSINALNHLIQELNNGVLDKNYMVDWNHYKNSILLYQDGYLNIVKTKIKDIITL